MKIKIFNREICVCALLATNSFMRKKQRRNGESYGRAEYFRGAGGRIHRAVKK